MDPGPEERTIRDRVLPRLRNADWTSERMQREYLITNDFRQVVSGRMVHRTSALRADIALLSDPARHPLAVVEAKRATRSVDDGVAQAKRYANLLDLPIAYATNGERIVEVNLRAGTEHDVDRFRTPDEIWDLFRGVDLGHPVAEACFRVPYSRAIVDSRQEPKRLRYYQGVAVKRILGAISRGQQRILAVLATGTGKSYLAAQLTHVLWGANWPRGAASTAPRPRVLYLADRDVLVNDPLAGYFRPMFGEAASRISGRADNARQINFALYQALDVEQSGGRRLYESYDPDWYDLIIVDECHRGSAEEDSVWRGILQHFSGATQLGLTATPRHDADVQTAEYFGAPEYEYSLRQGIEDGFLAPFEVVRVLLDSYVDGVYVPEGVRDLEDDHEVPAGQVEPSVLDRTFYLEENTALAAQYLTAFLRGRSRMEKTIVFCRSQEHAARFAREIGNQNADLQRQHGNNWCTRITSDDGEPGKVLLGDFQDEDRPVPVVVCTSDLLTTGVDVPTAKNIVFLTDVRSRSRFKQMVGRGTRLDLERGKEYFTVIDFRGVTRMFADPSFDGPTIREVIVRDPGRPESVDEPLIDDADVLQIAETSGEFVPEVGGVFPEPPSGDAIVDPDAVARIEARAAKHHIRGIEVRLLGDVVYVVEPGDVLRLRPVALRDWVREQVLELGLEPADLRSQWASVAGRRELDDALRDAVGWRSDELAQRLGEPDAEPLDLLLSLAYGEPLRTRHDRRSSFTRRERAFLAGFSGEARRIIDVLLDKYERFGPRQLSPETLSVPPLSEAGSVIELAQAFGGPAAFNAELDELGRRLFDAG